MTEMQALARGVYASEETEAAAEQEYEVTFDEPGDLGISVSVDAEGAVVVGGLKQMRGYAELSCPTLHVGDVLVAVDNEPVTELSYSAVMAKLRASAETRPTRLEFLAVGRFDTADSAVAKWQQRQRGFAGSGDGDDVVRVHEGEFDVTFAPLQPTGLRFSESYIMTTLLKLAHVETALFAALGLRTRDMRAAAKDALLHSLLVRVGDDSVLGAPVDDVMALLYDAESFPKTLWLARAESLQQDYQVVTLGAREQLKWFCFVPTEMMMEVAVVSYAALASRGGDGGNANSSEPEKQQRPRTPSSSASQRHRQRTRSDGICEHQYLMAVNGFPTLRVSAAASFSDDGSASAKGISEDDGVVAAVNHALDALLAHERVLRFRDLKAYRREFLAHAPLSPWQRRRRSRTSTSGSSASSSPIAATPHSGSRMPTTATAAMQPPVPVPLPSPAAASGVRLEHKPQRFFELLQQEQQSRDAALVAQDASDGPSGLVAPTQRPPAVKRYYGGLANCEGVRSFAPIVSGDVKRVVVPDNRRPVGIQLETDVLPSGRPVFRAFVRGDGPAAQSGRVHAGDRVVAVNGVAVEEIPTDLLVRILHGEEFSLLEDATLDTSGSRRRGLLLADSTRPRRRVLRLARRDATPPGGLLGQAKRLLALSTARLSLWKGSQPSRASLVQ